MINTDSYADISLPDSTIWLFRQPLISVDPQTAFINLLTEIPWEIKHITIYGREIQEPRMTSWHGDPGCHYTYSKTHHEAKPWTETLSLLKEDMNRILATNFNSALCNYYRDGRDSIGAHSDNEPEMGQRPVIASLNLGGERTIKFRSKKAGGARTDVLLPGGSLLVMAGNTQKNYTHQIDKVKHANPRINITFRTIYPLAKERIS